MEPMEGNNKSEGYCIVWTTLPLISVLLPTVGHVGTVDSAGTINDFCGPYFVNKGHFMCGPPRRVWKLDSSQVEVGSYVDAILHAASVYVRRMHIIFADN